MIKRAFTLLETLMVLGIALVGFLTIAALYTRTKESAKVGGLSRDVMRVVMASNQWRLQQPTASGYDGLSASALCQSSDDLTDLCSSSNEIVSENGANLQVTPYDKQIGSYQAKFTIKIQVVPCQPKSWAKVVQTLSKGALEYSKSTDSVCWIVFT